MRLCRDGARPGAEATRLEDMENDAVLPAHEREGGNQNHTAKWLGIFIRSLRRKLKAWGLSAQNEAAAENAADDRRG